MGNDNNTITFTSESFKSIRNYLEGGSDKRPYSIGIFATVIEDENTGIYTWDRFGRFGKADKAAKERILNLLAEVYYYEFNLGDIMEHIPNPLENAGEYPNNLMDLFGWPIEKLPDFEKFVQQNTEANSLPPKRQAKAGDTKKQNTFLIIIGALRRKLKIDHKNRGEAPEIKKMVEEIGCTLDVETIRNVLKNVESVVEIKSKL